MSEFAPGEVGGMPITELAVARKSQQVVGAVTVTDGGAGYAEPPAVSFSSPHGPGPVKYSNRRFATGVARIEGGQVVGIDITDEGQGYQTDYPPTVTIEGGATAAVSSRTTGYRYFLTWIFDGEGPREDGDRVEPNEATNLDVFQIQRTTETDAAGDPIWTDYMGRTSGGYRHFMSEVFESDVFERAVGFRVRATAAGSDPDGPWTDAAYGAVPSAVQITNESGESVTARLNGTETIIPAGGQTQIAIGG